MRIAVISDIHSNLEAFEAVIGDIDSAGVDDIISLGDNIGYGADPEKVINIIQKRQIKSVLGNHELALIDKNYLRGFNPKAKEALTKNRAMLSKHSINFIKKFDVYCLCCGGRFVHGLPPDSMTEYLKLTPLGKLKTIMDSISERICFVGHTHLLEIIRLKKSKITRFKITKKSISLDKESRYIINAGSVGQPRDKDLRAKYLIWDLDSYAIEARYISYDKRLAAAKIRKAGINNIYAIRLLM